MTLSIDLRLPLGITVSALLAALVLLLSGPSASAQSAEPAPAAQHVHTSKPPPKHGKVLGSIQRGSDAAGRGVTHADRATRSGVESVSERASRPLRRLGESIGRKLPRGAASRTVPPAVGPQGSAP